MNNCSLFTALSVSGAEEEGWFGYINGLYILSGIDTNGYSVYKNTRVHPFYGPSRTFIVKQTGSLNWIVGVQQSGPPIQYQPYYYSSGAESRCPFVGMVWSRLLGITLSGVYVQGILADNPYPYAYTWGSREEFLRIAGGTG